MQKILLVIIIVMVLVTFVAGILYFSNKQEVGENTVPQAPEAENVNVPDLGNLAPEMDIGTASENPLVDMPETNPLEDVPNPFDSGYENPFDE